MAKQQPIINLIKKPASFDSKFKCGTDAAGAGTLLLLYLSRVESL